MKEAVSKILDIFFPNNFKCIICEDEVYGKNSICCDKCLEKLPLIEGDICLRCGLPETSMADYCERCKIQRHKVKSYDFARASFIYDDTIKKLVHGLKFGKKRYLAKDLAKFMADTFVKNKMFADFFVPVPLTSKRLKERGYNQAQCLAEELGEILNVPVEMALSKNKDTIKQAKSNYAERITNLTGAFSCSKSVKDKTVVIVDDVFTTGATATECAKTVKRAGAKAVFVLTLAHTVLNKERKN